MNFDKEWFVHERAKALAMVLLTRRDDLVITETKEESGLDYTVYINGGDVLGQRPFGIYIAAAMSPITPDVANKQLKPAMGQVQKLGPFRLPVCVFYYTAKDDQGYYSWASQPLVTEDGQPRLKSHLKAHSSKLGNESLEEIVAAVRRWYDAFYATITT